MRATPVSRQAVVEGIKRAHATAGSVPSFALYHKLTGHNLHAVKRHFGGWAEALRQLGLRQHTRGPQYDHVARLTAWARLARRLKRLPTITEFSSRARGSHATLSARCAGWKGVPDAFREFAEGKPEWADVLALCPARDPRRTGERVYPHLPRQPDWARPIDFRGLRHEPDCESSVVFLFGMIAGDLGFRVERVQQGFPDCEALRCTVKRRWQRVRIEFEFESRRFQLHGHDPSGCDIIVCWRHNWPECPATLEVIELSTAMQELDAQRR